MIKTIILAPWSTWHPVQLHWWHCLKTGTGGVVPPTACLWEPSSPLLFPRKVPREGCFILLLPPGEPRGIALPSSVWGLTSLSSILLIFMETGVDAPVSIFSTSCFLVWSVVSVCSSSVASLEPLLASLGPLLSDAASGSVSGSSVLFLLVGPGPSPSDVDSTFCPYSPLLWPCPYLFGGGALDLVVALFSRDSVWESPHSFLRLD